MAISKRKPVKKTVKEDGSQGAATPKNRACIMCGLKGDYYASKNPVYAKIGQLPWCKNCLFEIFSEAYRRFQDNEKSIIELCKKTNIPFFTDCFNDAKEKLENKGIDIMSGYFFAFSKLRSSGKFTFFDSDIFDYGADGILHLRSRQIEANSNQEGQEITTPINEIVESLSNSETDEDFFGMGFSSEEYRAMRKKYEFLKDAYPEVTNFHTEAILKYVRYSVKEEFAMAKGTPKEAKEWADLASKAASNAKINPAQMSKSDLIGGANSFGEIVQAIEQAKDIIHILPQFKYQPNDAIDMLLWNYMDYSRSLEGLPRCSYEDIYKFYDKKKQDYIKNTGDTYGIYKDDPTENNREIIKDFISDVDKYEEIELECVGDDDEGE